MALNEVYRDGFSLPYDFGTSNPNIASGDFVSVGEIRGVAETDSAKREDGRYWATIRHIGVFRGTTADAVAMGDPMYLASAATKGTALTKTATGNELVGVAIKSKTAGAGSVEVRINN